MLSTENVQFVNQVFREFVSLASENTLLLFDLDRPRQDAMANLSEGWPRALGSKASHYLRTVDSMMRSTDGNGSLDVLLFLALMRQESNFNPRNISSVGAVGLTQIMPRTAVDLGMENIHMPSYLEDAGSLLRKERRLKYRARSLISEMTPENKIELAVRARRWMLEAADSGNKARDLYDRYRNEVLDQGSDDRLDPEKAIRYGYVYFRRMMKNQNGDISLALASYNAGPHRVQQYQGIPPYDETVKFRNRVIRYYREYLRRVERYRTKDSESVH
jgi:soluble lytic murein transglycosylase-like protein